MLAAPTSSCKTLDDRDPCGPLRLEAESELLADEGDFKGLYELYLPCALEGEPGAELAIAFLISGDIDSEILELDEAEREAEVLRWTCRSARHGHEDAIETMRDSYRFGWFGLPKDPEKEACWEGRLEAPEISMDCRYCRCPSE